MQRIVIIGATSGIGRALAELYAKAGNKVGIAGRRLNLLAEQKTANPELMIVKQLDVCDLGTLMSKLDELVTELGGMDLLIFSSGTGEINPALDFELEKPTLDTNVLGFTAVVDWGYRYFQRQGAGHLAAITSVAALQGEGVAPAYSASKAYQVNYLDALQKKSAKDRVEKGRANIVVTDIRPGFVDTDMAKGPGLFWMAPVEKAARQIATAIRRKRQVVYITRRWRLIGFVLRLLQMGK